jgi:hypothetical protein
MSRLTRRRLLGLGAAAGFAAIFGRPAAAARGATGGGGEDAPAHLRRSSYVPLTGAAFGVAGTTLTLAAVGDLARLAGRDDAFRLELLGAPDAFTPGIQPVRHRTLGAFELFLSPIGRIEDGVQRYEVVIDRSVPLPAALRDAPRPAAAAPAPAETVADAPAAAGAPAAPARRKAVRRRRRRPRHAIHRRRRRHAIHRRPRAKRRSARVRRTRPRRSSRQRRGRRAR